jgi:lipid A ethanolaminephosphotransferase
MRNARNPLALAVGVSLWLAFVSNWPLWRALAPLPEMDSLQGWLFIAGFALMLACANLALLALGAWQRSIKPLATLLLLVAAAGAYFIGSYGVVIDPAMMVNVLQTDPREAGDLLGPKLLPALVLSACLAMALLALQLPAFSSTMRNHKSLRYMVGPANTFYSLGRVAFGSARRGSGPPAPSAWTCRACRARPTPSLR